MKYTINIDDREYIWEHDSCRCLGHCNSDKLYVDGEFCGRTDNPELCSLVISLIESAKRTADENNT